MGEITNPSLPSFTALSGEKNHNDLYIIKKYIYNLNFDMRHRTCDTYDKGLVPHGWGKHSLKISGPAKIDFS